MENTFNPQYVTDDYRAVFPVEFIEPETAASRDCYRKTAQTLIRCINTIALAET